MGISGGSWGQWSPARPTFRMGLRGKNCFASCRDSRIVGTKAATGGADEAAKEALKTFGSVTDKLYMLRSTAERRGIDVNSPFIIDEWLLLLLLTDRGVPVGGAENPAPTSW